MKHGVTVGPVEVNCGDDAAISISSRPSHLWIPGSDTPSPSSLDDFSDETYTLVEWLGNFQADAGKGLFGFSVRGSSLAISVPVSSMLALMVFARRLFPISSQEFVSSLRQVHRGVAPSFSGTVIKSYHEFAIEKAVECCDWIFQFITPYDLEKAREESPSGEETFGYYEYLARFAAERMTMAKAKWPFGVIDIDGLLAGIESEADQMQTFRELPEGVAGNAPSHSPWIERADMILLMQRNKVGGKRPADRTIGQWKQNWNAEEQPGSNWKRFRFPLAHLRLRGVEYPDEWNLQRK